MTQTDIIQPYGDQTLTHVLVSDGSGEAHPGVLMFPTVMGVSPLEIGFAEKLVALGYSVLVADLFGRRFQPGADREAAFAAMGALRADRAALRDRLRAIASVANVRSTSPVQALPSPGSPASMACSTRRACLPIRSRPRSSPIMAGTTRWCRQTRSLRWAGSSQRRAPTGKSTPTAMSGMASPIRMPLRWA
jgi:hypothetical protein